MSDRSLFHTMAYLGSLILASILVLTACSTSNSAQVPVLWISRSTDGGISGGVSHATATMTLAGTTNTSGYRVDLNNQGGQTGQSWDSAASMASAVAVLYSAVDPRGVTSTFEVDTDINGASAGGALTIAALSALRSLTPSPKVAMTGTISPDGGIGYVDGVEAKVRAAAEAGYTTVLIPVESATPDVSQVNSTDQQNTDSSDMSRLVDASALSQELGISVQPIGNVGQAMQAFTGQTIGPPANAFPDLSPSVTDLVTRQTTRLLATATRELNALRVDPPSDLASGTVFLDQAQESLTAGDIPTAYGLGAVSLILIRQAAAQLEAENMRTKLGVLGASTYYVDHARREAAALSADIRTKTHAFTLSPRTSRFPTMSALTWAARSAAIQTAVADELSELNGSSATDVDKTAQILAQYSVMSDVIYPDSWAVAEATSVITDAEHAQSVASYADLFRTAAVANQEYYENVLTSIGDHPELNFSQPGHLYAEVEQLETASLDFRSNPFESCVWAWSYFLNSSLLVSANQSYGLQTYGIGTLSLKEAPPIALTQALSTSEETASSWAADLNARGIDADHAVWESQWSRAQVASLSDTSYATTSYLSGLTTSWMASTQLFGITADVRQIVE